MPQDPAGLVLQLAATEPRCVAQHLGPWMIEPAWFGKALAAVRAGEWPVSVEAVTQSDRRASDYTLDADGIAIVRIIGQTQKGESKYGGTSTIRLRRALRDAAADDAVKAVLLAVDSPGGTVAGTAELADAVTALDKAKPVFAYIEDLGASAAYYVAAQARRISANAAAQVGSIGTLVILEDYSAQAEQLGIKVHVVSSGPFKGAFAVGAEIPPDHIAYAQDIVDVYAEQFNQAVKRGRNLSIGAVRELADGRTHIGAQAKELRLIDAVEPFDETLKQLRKEIPTPTPAANKRARAERKIAMQELSD